MVEVSTRKSGCQEPHRYTNMLISESTCSRMDTNSFFIFLVLARNLRSPHTTPKKTPKRKLAGINWPANVTHFFLELCLERKEYTQLDTVPLRVWKDISEVMLNEGHSGCDWQSCRDKFNSLNAFFLEPLLALRGVMSGVKWPHFDIFLNIHDIPLDYDVPETVNLGENTPSKKGMIFFIFSVTVCRPMTELYFMTISSCLFL
jgi:hypothetical protein